jgi:hypothetical protein
MRNFRLLLLIAAVAAVGSYSAFAGSDRSPGENNSVASQQANDAPASQSSQAQEGEGAEDGPETDKVAQAIADEFGVSKDEVLARHGEGIGFGALFKLYKLARAKGISVDELLATIPTDANGKREFGFGQLRKGLTPEQRALHESGPKNLGRLVSGTKEKHSKPAGEGAESGATGTAGNSGHVPPGQAKKAAWR